MYASLRGTRLYFDVDGMGLVPDGDRMQPRPTLVLLHGGPGGDHSSFKTSLNRLTDVAQLVYLDHRGSGRSAAVDAETCTLNENVEDLDALRAYLGLEKISILGSSYGGMVAQGYAIRYPDHVDRLILASTAPSFRFLQEARNLVSERGTPDQIRVCEALWNAEFTSLEQLHEYYRTMGPMYATSFDEEKFEAGWRRGIRNYAQLNSGFGGFLRDFDFTDQLATIVCPTLVLAGALDWICPPSQARSIAERIPEVRLEVFENSAHAIAQDEPEKFMELVRRFLGELSAQAEDDPFTD
ncbi:MAG: prolyl aminopeptidase [Planctomycetaceae bacterium]|nr:prolyl aminopeptidase [Planctomycetaceae bacterium]